MGIVLKESYKNTITLLIAILVGALNTLVLYVYFLETTYYGLVTFVLSTAFVLKPFIALGVNHSIVKFFSSFDTNEDKDRFLGFVVLLPVLIIVPVAIIGTCFYERISAALSQKNELVKNYTYLIFLVAIAYAYFEIFYAWARVHLKTFYGNVLKELFVRLGVSVLLLGVYLKFLNNHQFVLCLVGLYFLQTFLMMRFALKQYKPKFTGLLPENYKEILKYCLYIILAGSAATILLDIDKFMIPQKELIEQVSFYAVAVYIGSVIEIPGRAMSQIIQPLTAKALNANKKDEVLGLYQKSSINLLIASGLLFVLINANINSLYKLLPSEYTHGIWVVFFISTAKLYHMFLGSNGAIISNSKYYKILLPYGIAMAAMVILLNHWFIDVMGINGAALATLIVVGVFNTIKLLYVRAKFGMQPTTTKTWATLGTIAVLAIAGFKIELYYHPIVNILLESVLLGVIYVFVTIQFQFSSDINKLWNQLLGKLKK